MTQENDLLKSTANAEKTFRRVLFALLIPLPLIAGYLAYGNGYVLPVAFPGGAAVFALIGGVLFNYATEGRKKREIRKAFNQYLHPTVIEQLVDNPEKLKLGGEKREISIFFSDLEGFTSIAEGLEPEALTSLLNDYLTEMTDIILDIGGTIDKYEGDAIIAFWNAPLDQPDHAERAVKAALACQARLADASVPVRTSRRPPAETSMPRSSLPCGHRPYDTPANRRFLRPDRGMDRPGADCPCRRSAPRRVICDDRKCGATRG